MKREKAKQYASLGDLFTGEKAEILRQCHSCGACLETCPVFPLTSFSHEKPADILQKVLEAIESKPSEIAREMAYSCTYCAMCLNSCPSGLNPYYLQEILRCELAGCGYGSPSPKPQIGNKVFDLEDVVGHLQIKPSQIRWLTEMPARPERKDVLLFLGCSLRVAPEKSLALTDLMEMMGIDFVAVGGGDLCCGRRYLRTGDLAKADRESKEFLTALSAFQPKKVAFACGTCLFEVDKVASSFADIAFETMHVSKLLADEIHRLKFKNPIKARVAIHDPCNLSRKGGDVESVRKLLGAIPGVTLVEMAHNKEKALCCGMSTQNTYPDVANTFAREVLREAEETGAQILATVCIGCHRSYCLRERNYPFEVKNFINLVAEAAGLSYEDKLKKYLQMGNVDKIIADARENIEASPYTLEEYKKLLPLYFGPLEPQVWPSPA